MLIKLINDIILHENELKRKIIKNQGSFTREICDRILQVNEEKNNLPGWIVFVVEARNTEDILTVAPQAVGE